MRLETKLILCKYACWHRAVRLYEEGCFFFCIFSIAAVNLTSCLLCHCKKWHKPFNTPEPKRQMCIMPLSSLANVAVSLPTPFLGQSNINSEHKYLGDPHSCTVTATSLHSSHLIHRFEENLFYKGRICKKNPEVYFFGSISWASCISASWNCVILIFNICKGSDAFL